MVEILFARRDDVDLNATIAAKNAAELAKTGAETARTGAETAQTAAVAAQAGAETAKTNAETAATSAALSAAKLQGTSTTSVAIGTGSKAFITQADKFFDVGVWLLIASEANETNYMHGQVTAYSGTSLTVNVTNVGGSGTFADWDITVGGTRGATGAPGAYASEGAVTTGNLAIFGTAPTAQLKDTGIVASQVLVTGNIGSTVQAFNARLVDIAGLAVTDSNFIVGNGTNWVAESGPTVRTSLGLGNAATHNEATASELLSATADKIVEPDVLDAAMAPVALTDGVNIALNLNTGVYFTVTLAANRTLDNPTNHRVGRTIVIKVKQDATGSRTLSYGTQYDFGQSSVPTLSTAANTEDLLMFFVASATKMVYLGYRKGIE